MDKYSMSLKYGVIAGTIMIVIVMLFYFASVNSLAGLGPRIVYVVLIFAMIWGGITARRKLGNFSDFGHAFLTVFIISFTATMLFDSFHYILYTVIDRSIPVIVKQKTIESATDIAEKLGASDEKTEEVLKPLRDRDFMPDTLTLFETYTQSIIIGGILSALIGLFVNRPDERPV